MLTRLYYCSLLLIVAAVTEQAESFVASTPIRCSRCLKSRSLFLLGILDDFQENSNKSDLPIANASTQSNDDNVYENLLNNLVFSTRDTRSNIIDHMQEYTNPNFVQYLDTMIDASNDAEECQALKDVLVMINDISKEEEERRRAAAEKQSLKQSEIQKEAQKAHATSEGATMSAADVLKRANAIDQAVMLAEASEEEESYDFMRDAKAVCGLAGFNNRGQMRVGGG